MKSFKNEIVFDNISYTYKNSKNPALDSISLTIPSKSSIAIVGGSGSGKTSLADLPSIAVPSTLRKSLSATPLVNFGTLVFDIPVSNTAAVPNPMSPLVSDALLLSKPFVVNLAFDFDPKTSDEPSLYFVTEYTVYSVFSDNPESVDFC